MLSVSCYGMIIVLVVVKKNIIMRTIYLGTFASLVNKKSERSLVNAIKGIIDNDDSSAFWYNYIRSGVKRFFAMHCDYGILNVLQEKLFEVKPATDFQRNNWENSKLAVQHIMSMSYELFDGKDMAAPTEKSIAFHGIELNINPDAIITCQDKDGKTHVGAIKTKLKKGAFRPDEGTMTACLIQYYLTIIYPDYIVEPDYCICFDAFRRKFYTSKNYDINISTAASIAEKIAAMGDVAA